jgi:N-acyl-D-amino-acid deacylase
MFDVLIKNGTIIDGTGAKRFRADIGVKEDKIKKIGELQDEKGEVEIDAKGRIVCPGFVDVNNHSDTYWQIFSNPNLESLVYQGITTIIGGNCGSSLAPLATAENIASIQKWVDLKTITLNWLRTKEFFDVLEKNKLSVNFATLVGHGTLRRGILKDESRSLVQKEINFIKKLLTESLKAGALGMSTGLIYTHARLASKEELIDLAKEVARLDGVYATHMREEGKELVESIEEALEISRESGVRLHISHLKAMGKSNWSKIDEALKLLEHGKEQGVDVTFDVYPYTNTGSVLYTFLPSWVTDGGRKMMLHRLKDQAARYKVISDMKSMKIDFGQIEIAISSIDKALRRRKISEIAKAQEKTIFDTVIDILIASEGRVITSSELLSEENVEKEIKHPLSIFATNGSGYSTDHRKSGEVVHPRCFGTFPLILEKYVVKKKLLSWEEAIKKMTGMPASKFNIPKRGVLAEDYFADMVIIDQKNISSLATKADPYQYSRGIDFVLTNGKITLGQGMYLGGRFGRVIRK